MLLFSPYWIAHKNDKGHATPIYSLAVHPFGKRLATGGQDSTIKLWNLDPVYEEGLEREEGTPKLLATLAAHSGSVLCVRWSNDDGTYLASGSDDYKIVLWKQDRSGIARNLVMDTEAGPPVESWKAVKVLAGHESDVADLAWSPENKYLASCGFETTIYIWDGQGFDLIRKLHAHTAFVKGVTWDPVGKYLASQSDDKTTKIWRVADWTEETSITKPYEAAASTTFFRRLSWSPEGSCIITANGESGNRPVAPQIQRNDWSADVSLVGHKGPIECAAFSPQLYEIKGKDGPITSAICAVGGQDNTISVWQSAIAHPVMVNQDVFHHSILDICWAPDGKSLFACSYDGSIGVISFDEGELGVLLPPGHKEQALTALGVKRKAVIESVAQLGLEELNRAADKEASSSRITALLGPASSTSPAPPDFTRSRPVVMTVDTPAVPFTQKVTQTVDGRKRIKPTFLSTAAPTPLANGHNMSAGNLMSREPRENTESTDASSSGVIPIISNKKRKANSEVNDTEGVKYILPTVMDSPRPVNLAVPSVQARINIQIAAPSGAAYSLECDNTKKPPKVICARGSEVLWADFIPSKAILVTGNRAFVAVACVDGSLLTYSSAGRRLLPCISLESTASYLTAQGDYLMCLTGIGTLTVWNIVRETTTIQTNVVHLLKAGPSTSTEASADAAEEISITSANLKREGMPVLTTTNHDSYTFHPGMQTWMKIGDAKEPLEIYTGKSGSLRSMTLSQIENQMACAITLRSSKGYANWLRRYAVKLADEGAVTKTQELCDELLGPRSSSSICTKDEDWSASILGMPKRHLLTTIIPHLSKNRSMQRTIEHYQRVLDEIRDEEHHKSLRL